MPHPEPLSGERAYAEDVAALAVRTPYTPSITATTTNPDLGTFGLIEGSYYATGGLVYVWFNVFFGSGADPGSGDYRISVPSAYPIDSIFLDTSNPLIGNIRLRDNSAPNEEVWVPFTGSSEGSGNISIRDPGSPNSQEAGDNNPWIWAVNDRIIGSFSYLTSET